jgi:hypothetical protein
VKTKSIQWLARRWAAARGHAKTILANPQPHGEPSTDWLTRTWADGRAHAETIRRALDGRTGRAVVLENRRLGGAPSVMTLASLLQSTRRFPAILVVCTDLIEFDRVALTEAMPCATIQVVDWCHPASPEPTDITLLGEPQLPRSLGALAGYDAATIAVFTGITSRPSGRQHQAIRALMHSASDPLFVLEEWTHPDLLAAAAARLTGSSDHQAGVQVDRWLEQPRHPSGLRTHPCPDGLLAARELAVSPLRAVA